MPLAVSINANSQKICSACATLIINLGDQSCLQTCNLPLLLIQKTGYKSCEACSTFYNPSSFSCEAGCALPLAISADASNNKICSACASLKILASDQSCITACTSPLLLVQKSGYQSCESCSQIYKASTFTCDSTCALPNLVI